MTVWNMNSASIGRLLTVSAAEVLKHGLTSKRIPVKKSAKSKRLNSVSWMTYNSSELGKADGLVSSKLIHLRRTSIDPASLRVVPVPNDESVFLKSDQNTEPKAMEKLFLRNHIE